MNRVPKPRKCLSTSCRQLFTPVRKGLSLTKYCCTACELDHAESSGNLRGKEKPKVKKPKTAAKLKKELWPIFSLHQKLVHSADGEWCQCYTCNSPIKIGTINCQGGHCVPKGAYKNLYFDERAVRPQCYSCNINYGGMHYDFCEKLKLEIGLEAFNDMMRHGKDAVKRSALWYQEQINYYSSENKNLKELKK